MPSGLDEITRKEIVTRNPQAKGSMLLRKPISCLSFNLPVDHRPGAWVGQRGSLGAGRALFVGRWAPTTTPEARTSLDPGRFLHAENINQCSVQEAETTLGILSRKRLNAGN